MLRKTKIKNKLSKGFTLVEILVVLVIVAILAGLAFVKYGGLVSKGYAAEAEPYLKDVSNAVTLYEDMYVIEFLKFISKIYKNKKDNIDQVIEQTGLKKTLLSSMLVLTELRGREKKF